VIIGLHHLQLAAPAGSEPALRRFYGAVLGMAEIPEAGGPGRPGRGVVPVGKAEVHLGVDVDFRPARKAHPALLVDDLDATVTRLAEAGHNVRPDELLPGYRHCYFDDPCGDRLELLTPVS
jgi:catechol 2,3-dioxygenase-like lactoylglutathione lyase family enzyme